MPSKLLLTIALLLVVGGIVGAQAYQLYRNQIDFESNYAAPTLAPVQATQVGMSLEQVANLQLFGNAKTAPVIEEAPKEMPKTDLKLVLVGAINSSDSKQSSALIQNGSETKRYFIGDSLDTGVVLHEVRKNEVVLKRDNRFETLSFPKLIESAPAPLGYGRPRTDDNLFSAPNTRSANRPQVPARPRIVQPQPQNAPSALNSQETQNRFNAMREQMGSQPTLNRAGSGQLRESPSRQNQSR